jgi:hypothetical protein
MRKRQPVSQTLKRLTGKSGKRSASASEVTVKLDRLQFYCNRKPTDEIRGIPDLKSVSAHRLNRPTDGRFQAFGRAHWFQSRISGMKLCVESERRESWLPPYRLTLYADDRTGLLHEEVLGVLEVLADFRMTMVELALDFSPESMNRKFIREHVLFGKSRPVASVSGTDYYGTRMGTKRVQAYIKEI